MSRKTVAPMHCVAVPSASLRARMGVMYPERGAPGSNNIMGILDDLVKVDALAALLTEAIEQNQKPGGRLDERDVAVHVLTGMMRDGHARRPNLALVGNPPPDSLLAKNIESMAVDMMVAAAFGRLITRAIETTQEKDGLTKMQNVAVFILRAMKESRIT